MNTISPRLLTILARRLRVFFSNGAQAILLSDTDWTYEEEYTQLKESIDEISAKSRVEETKKMIKTLEKSFQPQVNEFVSLYFKTPGQDMWVKILKKFQEVLADHERLLLKRAKSFNSSEEENTKSIENLRKRSWQQLRKKIDDELADNMFLLKLRERFEEKFRYDDEGLPKVWKPEDDIDAHFRKAREEAVNLIPLFSAVKIPDGVELNIPSDEEFDFEDSLIILSETKQHDLSVRFKRESDAFYLEAKRSVVSTTAHVPYWVMVLLVALGWNEFIVIVTSPIYLVLFSFLGFVGYIIYMLNLFGPVETAARMIAAKMLELMGEVFALVKEQLKNNLNKSSTSAATKSFGLSDGDEVATKKEQ